MIPPAVLTYRAVGTLAITDLALHEIRQRYYAHWLVWIVLGLPSH